MGVKTAAFLLRLDPALLQRVFRVRSREQEFPRSADGNHIRRCCTAGCSVALEEHSWSPLGNAHKTWSDVMNICCLWIDGRENPFRFHGPILPAAYVHPLLSASHDIRQQSAAVQSVHAAPNVQGQKSPVLSDQWRISHWGLKVALKLPVGDLRSRGESLWFSSADI